MDLFSGDDPSLQIEDWLPGLQWVADWYAWTDAEYLLQLAGHLCSQALQEWNLMDSADKATLDSAVKSLKAQLDPGNKLVASPRFSSLISAGVGDSFKIYFTPGKAFLKWHMAKMTWVRTCIVWAITRRASL